MRRVATVALVGVLLLGADDPKIAEQAKFQGTWQLIAAESNGEKAPEERVKSVRVTITENSHTVRVGDQVVAHDVSFAIDPSKTPKEVTDTINEGPNKGKQIEGIYNLEGDTLISCVAPIGKKRPTEFTAKAGSGLTLRVFRRAKPDDAAREAAIADELKKFDGTWRFDSIEMESKALPQEALKETRLVLKGDQFTLTEPQVTYRGVYSVNPTVTPKTIDVAFTEGPETGKIALGIYELEGDTYRVCIGLVGNARPAVFAGKAGSGHILEVLKREKP